jgi:hypothetical protein
MKRKFGYWALVWLCLAAACAPATPAPTPVVLQSGVDANPPTSPVKLVFVHHSTGGNWLADVSGNPQGGALGQALMNANYFVSATNYGWGPEGIGDRTDLGQWWEWFRGPHSSTYLGALYAESGKNVGDYGDYPRLAADPGGENEIVVFKSCYPNSALSGSLADPIPAIEQNLMRGEGAGASSYTVANAKGLYLDLLNYFMTRPDKLFVIVTAPPLTKRTSTVTQAANARAFNTWLTTEWLKDYPLKNVAVFDFYNVLTGAESYHRYANGSLEYLQSSSNFAFYPQSASDSHPNQAGNRKATEAFVPLLNVFYQRWKQAAP